jgi:hypothetical protein
MLLSKFFFVTVGVAPYIIGWSYFIMSTESTLADFSIYKTTPDTTGNRTEQVVQPEGTRNTQG